MSTDANNNVAQLQNPAQNSQQRADYGIPEDLISEIKRRATDEALRGLKDLWKREIEKVYEDFDASSYRNFRDALKALGDYVITKTRGSEAGQLNEPQSLPNAQQSVLPNSIDIEKLKAQIKADFEEKFKQEKRVLQSSTAFETLANYALAKGLNPKYKDMFVHILKSKYVADFDDEDKLVYRDPETKELVLEKGANPSLDYLITPFLESHKELFSVPKNGAGTAGGLPLGNNQNQKPTISHESNIVRSDDTIAMIDNALKGV